MGHESRALPVTDGTHIESTSGGIKPNMGQVPEVTGSTNVRLGQLPSGSFGLSFFSGA